MIKEHEVATSPNWSLISQHMHEMGVPAVVKQNRRDIVSHGVMVIVDGHGLFLQDRRSYEYMHILHGNYSIPSLYRCLSVMSDEERHFLATTDPHEQWSAMFPHRRMPRRSHRKMVKLQQEMGILLSLIPSQHEKATLNIPKGRLSMGETSMEAAVRELEEETGIRISVDQLEDVMVDKHLGTDGNVYVTYIYTVTMDYRPNVTLSPEFVSHEWLPI